MNYKDASEKLPNADFIYVDVTEEEIEAIKCNKYVSEIDGITIVGTIEPIKSLSTKKLEASFGMSFV